jgi:hypothetical protein
MKFKNVYSDTIPIYKKTKALFTRIRNRDSLSTGENVFTAFTRQRYTVFMHLHVSDHDRNKSINWVCFMGVQMETYHVVEEAIYFS